MTSFAKTWKDLFFRFFFHDKGADEQSNGSTEGIASGGSHRGTRSHPSFDQGADESSTDTDSKSAVTSVSALICGTVYCKNKEC